MATATVAHRYPAGTGWAAGYLLGLGVGILVWLTTGLTLLGLLVAVVTGPPLGHLIERGLDTAPFSPRQQRLLRRLALAGLLGLALIVLVGML